MLNIQTIQNIAAHAISEAASATAGDDVSLFPGMSLAESFSYANEQILTECVDIEHYITESEAMQITCATTYPENLNALQEAAAKGVLEKIKALIDRAVKFAEGLWQKLTAYVAGLKDKFTKRGNYKAAAESDVMKSKEFSWHDWNIDFLSNKARQANKKMSEAIKKYVSTILRVLKFVGNAYHKANMDSEASVYSENFANAADNLYNTFAEIFGLSGGGYTADKLAEGIRDLCHSGKDQNGRDETLANIIKAVPNPGKAIDDIKTMLGEASTTVGQTKSQLADIKDALDKYANEMSPDDYAQPAKNELMGKIGRDLSRIVSTILSGINASSCVVITEAQRCVIELGRVNDYCANADIHAKESGKVTDVDEKDLKPVEESANALDEGAIKNAIERFKSRRAANKAAKEGVKKIFDEYSCGEKLFNAYQKAYGHFEDDPKVVSTKEEMQEYVNSNKAAFEKEPDLLEDFERYDMKVVKLGDGYAYLELYVAKGSDNGEECGVIFTIEKNGKPKELYYGPGQLASYLARVENDTKKSSESEEK